MEKLSVTPSKLYFMASKTSNFFPQKKGSRISKVKKFGIKYERKRVLNLEACQAQQAQKLNQTSRKDLKSEIRAPPPAC